ncbi:MAG: phosphate acetyltransferase, partial [Lachnospiraceae bacterium]|nr:phosphate acetyltransferase [Lachnospiraceae bacterium]
MAFVDRIKEKAKLQSKTILLPETMDDRTYYAAEGAIKEGIANIVLIGAKDEIDAHVKATGVDISKAQIIDPANCDKLEDYVNLLYETRKAKGMTPEQAREILLKDTITFGIVALKAGDADGLVAGACHSTADTLRPSLQILKTKAGCKLVSAFFIMDVPNCEYGANGTFIFADSGLNQDPNPEELAAIAQSSAESFESLVGEKAVCAMLSHSTVGSAKHPLVDKMVEATRIAKEQYPDLVVDGEFQLDAAIVPAVAKSKAPNSDVAGKA